MTSQKDSKITLDDLDYGILNILIKDAKRSYVDIGKELDVSSGTVFVRVKKMADQNVIRGTNTDINYYLLGYRTIVYLSINLDYGYTTSEICDQLIAIKNVVEITPISGRYDIMCKMIFTSTYIAGEIIENEIKKVKGVRAIDSSIALAKSHKASLTVGKVS